MTNQEYEAACVTAAGCYDKFEGEHKLKQIDAHIAQVEKTLTTLNEMRREIVNQYNLNRPPIPAQQTPKHGDKSYGVSGGERVTNIYFKPTDKDKGCWLHENVYREVCSRRGIKHER